LVREGEKAGGTEQARGEFKEVWIDWCEVLCRVT
jgi:hypothetical protein